MLLCLSCFLIPAELKAQLTVTIVSSTNVICNGMCDGAATATAVGGVPPYAYLWNDSLSQTTATATGLCAGTYTITVSDSDTIPNSATVSVTIVEPPALVTSVSSVDESCIGCCDGSASGVTTGGSPPVFYLWNDSLAQTTATAMNLCSGTYCITITDVNGCTTNNCVIVTSTGCTLIVSTTATDVTTCGGSDGTATANPAGGVLPYIYLWNTGATTQSITGLSAGTYTVAVTDSSGCTSTSSAVVNEPGGFFVYLSSIDASCPTCADGSATVADSGGTPPYSYLWIKDSLFLGTTPTITGLLPGFYCVTVADSLGCTSSGCVVISDSTSVPCTLTSTITSTNASCGTCADGSATVTVAGGTVPYAYAWTKDSLFLPPVATITGLLYGLYCVTVTDAVGCTSSGCVFIDSTSVPANCSVFIYDSAGVALYAIPTLGTAPFTYLWSSGETTQSITPTGPGVYTVTITDNTGCSASASYQFFPGVCDAYFFPYIDSSQANTVYLIENSVGNNLTYLWDFGDGNTSNQQFPPTHTYNSYGTYNICLTVNDSIGGCVDIFCMLVQLDSVQKTFLGYSVIVVPDPFSMFTGINNEEGNYTETKIYPNPASSKVYLELSGWGASATLTMFNAAGQVLSYEVISLNPGKNTIELDLNNYHKGLYFLRIDSEKLRETKKISNF